MTEDPSPIEILSETGRRLSRVKTSAHTVEDLAHAVEDLKRDGGSPEGMLLSTDLWNLLVGFVATSEGQLFTDPKYGHTTFSIRGVDAMPFDGLPLRTIAGVYDKDLWQDVFEALYQLRTLRADG